MFIQVRCEKHIKRVRPWIKDKLFKVLLSFTKIVFSICIIPLSVRLDFKCEKGTLQIKILKRIIERMKEATKT